MVSDGGYHLDSAEFRARKIAAGDMKVGPQPWLKLRSIAGAEP